MLWAGGGGGAFSKRRKRPGDDADKSHLPSSEVKNEWVASYPFLHTSSRNSETNLLLLIVYIEISSQFGE